MLFRYEEVALFNHSKQKQELYEFNMVDLVEMLDEEPADKDGDGKLSGKEGKDAINKEIAKDKAVGNLEEVADEMEEGIEGVMSLIKKKGKEGAVKALKGKKEIDNPWALVNAALAKMGRAGLSSKKEEVLFTKEKPHKVIEPK